MNQGSGSRSFRLSVKKKKKKNRPEGDRPQQLISCHWKSIVLLFTAILIVCSLPYRHGDTHCMLIAVSAWYAHCRIGVTIVLTPLLVSPACRCCRLQVSTPTSNRHFRAVKATLPVSYRRSSPRQALRPARSPSGIICTARPLAL